MATQNLGVIFPGRAPAVKPPGPGQGAGPGVLPGCCPSQVLCASYALIAETLLRLRRQARDIALSRLDNERVQLCSGDRSCDEILDSLVDRALLDERALDRTFWLDALADFVATAPATQRDDRYQAATRRILATFRADPRRRHQAVRVLAERLVPLA